MMREIFRLALYPLMCFPRTLFSASGQKLRNKQKRKKSKSKLTVDTTYRRRRRSQL